MEQTEIIKNIEEIIKKTKFPIVSVIKDCHGEKIKSDIMRNYNAKVEDFGEFYRIYITK